MRADDGSRGGQWHQLSSSPSRLGGRFQVTPRTVAQCRYDHAFADHAMGEGQPRLVDSARFPHRPLQGNRRPQAPQCLEPRGRPARPAMSARKRFASSITVIPAFRNSCGRRFHIAPDGPAPWGSKTGSSGSRTVSAPAPPVSGCPCRPSRRLRRLPAAVGKVHAEHAEQSFAPDRRRDSPEAARASIRPDTASSPASASTAASGGAHRGDSPFGCALVP